MNENTQKPASREDIVIGRNAVAELLRSGREVERVWLKRGLGGSLNKLAAMAREKGAVVKEVDPAKLDSLCDRANHQGAVAEAAAARYSELEDSFALAKTKDEPVFFVIADEIEDPHNLGAIIRSAEAAGAHGLIIPKRRSAGLTFAVAKTSAGAVEHLPVIRVANLAETIKRLKERGVWVYAADTGGRLWCGQDMSGPLALVIGSEGKGVGRLIKEHCDFTVSLPMRGRITSLNASVAAGIILYEIARQRMNIIAHNKGGES
jgi:23S rRNA (guanosine2251-2'-O)-methyltransferase